jgi:hypothetical protein
MVIENDGCYHYESLMIDAIHDKVHLDVVGPKDGFGAKIDLA